MADFEHEQLKSLFERLAERLDKTSGDEEHLLMLANLRTSITRLQKSLANSPQRNNQQTVLQEFLKDFRGTTEGLVGKGSKGGGGDDTILRKFANDMLEDETDSRKKSAAANKQFKDTLNAAKSSLLNFDKGLDGSAASFASIIGLSGAASTKLFGAIDENVDMYRNLRQTGESSIDSIYGMRGAAQQFEMSTKQFVEAITKGTEGARQLGAIRFADINLKFRNATKSIGQLGLTADQITEAQQSYVQMLRDQGNLNTMDNGQIASGMERLIKSSNVTASILGKTREEVLKARENQAQDANFQTYLKTLSAEQQEALTDAATHIAESMGPAAAQQFKEQAMTGGAIITEQSAQRAALSPQETQMMNSLRTQIMSSGKFDQDMRTAFATQQRDLANSRSDIHNQQFAIMGAGAGGALSEIFTGINAGVLAQSQLTPEKANDGSETDRAIITMVTFERTMARLNAQFQALLDNILEPLIMNIGPAFVNMLEGAVSWLGRVMEGQNGLWLATGALVGGFVALKLGVGALHFMFTKVLMGGLRSLFNLITGRGLGGIGGRLMGGLAGRAAPMAAAAGGALGTAALVGGGVLAGGAGMFVGNRMVAGNAGESLTGGGEGEGGLGSSRLAGYGSSVAGGAMAGAAIGLLGGPVGAAIGAAIGGAVGLGAAGIQDYMSHRNRPENTVSPENRQQNQNRAPNPQNGQDAAAPGARTNRTTPEMINQRIASLTEAGNGHLRLIMENNRLQLEAMRQEMAEARNYYAASLRLHEDNNRALRQIGAVS